MRYKRIKSRHTDLQEPVRNRYFHGKMMDVYHFEMETEYFLAKQQLLNRLITGYGVVCGLDVHKVDRHIIEVTRGVAIDRWGRTLMVPQKEQSEIPTRLLPQPVNNQPVEQSLEQQTVQEPKRPSEEYRHVVLCYQECESDPVPALTNSCENWGGSEPGTIREKFNLEWRQGKAKRPEVSIDCRFPDVISEGHLDYSRLVHWVTKNCKTFSQDSCIPLANISFMSCNDGGFEINQHDIDITVRPISYTNDLLFNLISSLMIDSPTDRRGK